MFQQSIWLDWFTQEWYTHQSRWVSCYSVSSGHCHSCGVIPTERLLFWSAGVGLAHLVIVCLQSGREPILFDLFRFNQHNRTAGVVLFYEFRVSLGYICKSRSVFVVTVLEMGSIHLIVFIHLIILNCKPATRVVSASRLLNHYFPSWCCHINHMPSPITLANMPRSHCGAPVLYSAPLRGWQWLYKLTHPDKKGLICLDSETLSSSSTRAYSCLLIQTILKHTLVYLPLGPVTCSGRNSQPTDSSFVCITSMPSLSGHCSMHSGLNCTAGVVVQKHPEPYVSYCCTFQ